MARTRVNPNVKVRIASPNKSSRVGATPTLIVLHATVSHNRKGLSDLQAIGNYFRGPVDASSHVCVDNEANSARYVPDGDKAWHCAAYNRMSLGIEQILMADGTEITNAMYRETGRWIAYWSEKFGIPIQVGAVGGGIVTRRGVLFHSQLGSLGGGHSDPGRGYSMNKALEAARFYKKIRQRRS